MKFDLKPSLIVSCIIILLGVIGLFSRTSKVQGIGFLRLPFNQSQIYRINSYVDHDVPQFNNRNGSIVLFNGDRYGDCPADGSSWTINDGQGPYCYDSHSGIDWAMEEDTPVLATASGTVARVGTDSNYGNFVRINHGNGYDSLYAHLKSSLVNVGDIINSGDEIGRSGNTGTSGYHLHFEVRHSHNQRATDPFGWRSNSPDPLINYSGETAVCLWANEWCNETIVEDGDINFDGSLVKFAEFGNDWSPNNWRSQGNSWTMKYLPNGDGSSWAYWIPYLNPSGLYEVFVFIPAVFTNTITVTYTIHDKDTEHLRVVDQSAYPNQWVSLGSYHFGHSANNYIKLTNSTADATGTKRIVFDTIKFRQYRLLLPAILKNYHPDTYEPNNDFASAFGINPNEAYLSYIWGVDDEDWFSHG